MALETAIQVVALPETAYQDDAGYPPAFRSQTLYLPLDQIADLLDNWFKDVFDLVGRHNQEARVKPDLFVVGKTGETADIAVSNQPGRLPYFDLICRLPGMRNSLFRGEDTHGMLTS
jgi:hypothetical protein